MARIRSIKPEFWSDEKIVSLDYLTRLFFIGLWNFADDYGAFPDKPEQLKLLILPSEKNIDITSLLDLLIATELIEMHIDEERDSSYLQIKNWSLHQKVDHPTKSKFVNPNSKKVPIPNLERKKVAEKYGCKPGETKENECYFCGEKGTIYWTQKMNGLPGSWISFSHELSHLIPESCGGDNKEYNIVLACRNCNRSMGVKNAFDWLFNGKYTTNQTRPIIDRFRETSRNFENNIEESRLIGREGKGEDRKGEEKKSFFFEGNFSNGHEKGYLVAEMHKIWVSSFPTYTTNTELDYPALKNIADFIFTQAGTKNGFGNSDNEIKCLNTFQLIADQVNRETFWLNKPLKTISSHIQEFYNKIKNPINGTGKSKSGNGKLDEGLLKEKLAQRIREQQQNGS